MKKKIIYLLTLVFLFNCARNIAKLDNIQKGKEGNAIFSDINESIRREQEGERLMQDIARGLREQNRNTIELYTSGPCPSDIGFRVNITDNTSYETTPSSGHQITHTSGNSTYTARVGTSSGGNFSVGYQYSSGYNGGCNIS